MMLFKCGLLPFSRILKFLFTRWDVLHFVTLDLFCYASVVSHTHSFNVGTFQQITRVTVFSYLDLSRLRTL